MSAGLAVRDLVAGYRRRVVLHQVTLPDLAPGSLVAVIGPNAAGKSTFLKALAGLLPATGEIALDGAPLAALTPTGWARQVAYLPQPLPQASSLVVYEAVYAACRAVRSDWGHGRIAAAIETTLARLGMSELALRRLDELSGGQRQMVGLAQVLAREARLLLLDEPTSALDLRWQIGVLAAVRAATDAGAIALAAMHDINLALRHADRIVVLAGGRVLAADEPATAIDADILRRAYGVTGHVERGTDGPPIVVVHGIDQEPIGQSSERA